MPELKNPARDRLFRLVCEQAKDPGLWFIAETGPEAYLQEALRKLHQAVEKYELQTTRKRSGKK